MKLLSDPGLKPDGRAIARAVVLSAVLVLGSIAAAVEFGFDLGTRAAGLWPGDFYDFPRTLRGGVLDLAADVPLSRTYSVNLKVGSFVGTNNGSTAGLRPALNLSGIDARVALLATVPVVKNALSAYVGVGATYCWFRFSSGDRSDFHQRVSESGVTVGVPAGLKLQVSRRVAAWIEMEVPDYGVYHDVVEDHSGRWTLAWSQYGTLEPNVSAALYFSR